MKIKKGMMSVMDQLFMNCEQTTYYAIKELDQEKINPKERIKYKTHLFYCTHCKRFYQQSKTIDKIIKATPEDLENMSHKKIKLDNKTKEKIVKEVRKKINHNNL